MAARLSRKLLFIVTFWIIIIRVFAESDCSLEKLATSPLYSNLMPEDRPVKVINATNTKECVVHCYREMSCSGFIIGSVDSVCSMYDRRYKEMTFVNESGTQAYENNCGLETFAISPMYNNLRPEDRPLRHIKVPNTKECATLCYREGRCTGFIIGSEDGMCSLYARRYKSMAFVNHSGTQAYETIASDVLDCYEVFLRGFSSNGVYTVKPSDSGQPINVSCEVSSPTSGWLVIQRRTDGSEYFYRTWHEYRDGFGDLNNEFWLGNANIHRITNQGYYDLNIYLEDFEGNTRYALYKNFSVSSEDDFFRLRVGAYSGDAGDGLGYHRGNRFSAKDLDLDKDANRTCAVLFKGGWWYNACHHSNLNGQYLSGSHDTFADGVNWMFWLGNKYSLKKTVMKIRPIQF